MNNRGCGFSLDPQHVNFLQPGQRTMHTLNTYMLFENGRPVVVGGTPGSDIQVQTNLQVLTNVVDLRRSPQQAVEDPRWLREGDRVSLEQRIAQDKVASLARRGHDVQLVGPYTGHGWA